MRDIGKDDDQIAAILSVISHVDPDILLLTDFDYDLDGLALAAFQRALSSDGPSLPYSYATLPNAGRATGFDLDQDGRLGDPRDAMGFGRFAGDGGMALLSRWPIQLDAITNYTDLLWKDLPGATLPTDFWPDAITDTLALSSSNHLVLPIETPIGPLSLLAWSATPPVFDGPEDHNGLRNRDELRLWEAVLDGTLGPIPKNPVVIGNANLDPSDGDGLRDAMKRFLARPDMQDPLPHSAGGAANADPDQAGDPALDTADWPDDEPGNLRVSYILPGIYWTIEDAGVFWPAPDDPEAALLGGDGLAAGPHRLVWVDLSR